MVTKEELQPLFDFCSLNNIGDIVKEGNGDFKLDFRSEHFNKLGRFGVLFDGSAGGLVKGLIKNPTGGIWTISPGKNNTYRLFSRVLPGDYISHFKTYPILKNDFSEMENSADNFLKRKSGISEVPEDCRIIDTSDKKVAFVVLSCYTQFIFSQSTVKHFLKDIVSMEFDYLKQ